ncbi:uncharacterized protein [Haliotis asinina]|uniref:uncharacterized protein n=1 Tax=Haliotis asinina TaxID=109174 RepID=UPI0035325EDC
MSQPNDSDLSTSYDSTIFHPITSNIFTNPARLGLIQPPLRSSTPQDPQNLPPSDASGSVPPVLRNFPHSLSQDSLSSLSQEDLESSSSSTHLADVDILVSSNSEFTMGDSTLMPEHFTGKDSSHAEEWLDRFLHFANFKQWNHAQKIQVFPLFSKDSAYLWYKDVLQTSDNEFILFDDVQKLFKDKYVHPTDRWSLLEKFGSRKLLPTETIDVYLAELTETASLLGKTETDILDAFVRGLDDSTRQHVLMKQPKTLNDAVSFARLARSILPQVKQDQGVSTAIDTLREQIAALSAKLTPSPRVNTFQYQQDRRSKSASPPNRYPLGPPQPPHPQFWQQSSPEPYYQRRQQPLPQRNNFRQGRNMARNQQCYRCGGEYVFSHADKCPARNAKCHFCQKVGHFHQVCRARSRSNTIQRQ